jgi:hypothetical protein
MTKKSAARIQRDIAAGKRRATGTTTNISPVSRQPMQATENGGYKVTAADRILAECGQGLGLVPKEQKQVNTCWDDLMGVYRECARMLFQHTAVTQVLNDKELVGFIDDAVTFDANIKQFAADLVQMNGELQQLRALHADKTGGSEDPEVVLHSFAVYEQYKLWMTKHDGVVKPTIMHILEQTNQAELRRQAARAAQQEANPVENLDAGVLDVNTITDVEVREVADGKTLNLQASVNAGLEASKPEVMDAFLEQAGSVRGATSVVGQIDEAGFVPLEELNPVQAHHGEHHKHVHHGA